MKKFLLLLAITVMFSCSNDSEITPVNEFTEIAIPQSFKAKTNSNKSADNDGQFEVETLNFEVTDEDENAAKGFIRFTMPENHGEYLQNLEISSNIFTETNLTADFFTNKTSSKEIAALQKSSCIASCHSTYTDKDGKKIKGRGWCKAGCWAKIVIAAVGAAAAAAAF